MIPVGHSLRTLFYSIVPQLFYFKDYLVNAYMKQYPYFFQPHSLGGRRAESWPFFIAPFESCYWFTLDGGGVGFNNFRGLLLIQKRVVHLAGLNFISA